MNLSIKHIDFIGVERDEHGMPIPFLAYLIMVSSDGTRSIAFIRGLSDDSIETSVTHEGVNEGEAFEKARRWLIARPEHRGFTIVG